MEHITKDTNFQVDPVRFNISVKRNCDSFLQLIDAACIMITGQDQKYRYNNTLEATECVKLLQLLRVNAKSKVDIDVIDDAIALLNESPKILNDVVDAMTLVLKMTVRDEIHQSHWVSVIVHEHAISAERSQLSTILRYVKKSEVCERFLGFTNLVEGKGCHRVIGNHILNVAETYEFEQKFLAMSIDSAVLSTEQLNQLPPFIKSQCSFSYFVPCYFHELGHSLMRSVMHIPECCIFFKTVSTIESFVMDGKHRKEFEGILFRKDPALIINHDHYAALPFIALLFKYRDCFLEYFQQIMTLSRYSTPDEVVKASAFMNFLKQLETTFLLKMFNWVLGKHYNRDLSFDSEKAFHSERFYLIRSNITSQANNSSTFTEVWNLAILDTMGVDATDSSFKLEAEKHAHLKEAYFSLFQRILNSMATEFDLRVYDWKRLKIFNILKWESLTSMPQYFQTLMKVLIKEFFAFFDRHTLESEIEVLKEEVVSYNSVYELANLIEKNDLEDVFTELYKLVSLTLTLPVLPPQPSMDFRRSKLQLIHDYSYSPEATDIPSGEISVLCSEKQMLLDLKNTGTFHRDVLSELCKINMDLSFEQM